VLIAVRFVIDESDLAITAKSVQTEGIRGDPLPADGLLGKIEYQLRANVLTEFHCHGSEILVNHRKPS
jgi:hypothetical protein